MICCVIRAQLLWFITLASMPRRMSVAAIEIETAREHIGYAAQQVDSGLCAATLAEAVAVANPIARNNVARTRFPPAIRHAVRFPVWALANKHPKRAETADRGRASRDLATVPAQIAPADDSTATARSLEWPAPHKKPPFPSVPSP